MKEKLYKNKEWLQKEYDKYGHVSHISKEYGYNYDTICYWLKKHNITLNKKRRMSARTHRLNEDYFENIDNEHKAYWLGFIMADGCITQTDKKYPPNRFHFCLKREECEKEHLISFLNDIDGDYEIKEKLVENSKYSFESYIYELRINSKKFVNNLMKNGISMQKTGTEHIPSTIPSDLIRHFIRGYFDGDGSITVKKAFRICSSSEQILQEINNELNKINVNYKIYCDSKYKKGFYTIDSRNSKSNKATLDYLYKDATIYLNRKYKRYIEYFYSPSTE